jgi:peptidoglycan/LPS O-acetylase OafA/YrhL
LTLPTAGDISKSPPGDEPRRLQFIDAVRGLAASAVVLHHVAGQMLVGFADVSNRIFNFGRFGVCAFFLVSGFLIPRSLERAGSLLKFAVRRFFRLYPLYWLSLAAALGLSRYVDVLPPAFRIGLPLSAWINVTMFQEFAGFPHAIVLYYTLTIELAWYLGCGLLYCFRSLDRTIFWCWMYLGVFATLDVACPVLLDRRIPFSTPFYGLTLLFGAVISSHSSAKVSLHRLLCLTLAILLAGGVSSWIAQSYFGSKSSEGQLTFSAAALPWLAAYVMFVGAYFARWAVWPRPTLWLGRISYSLYLLHLLVLSLVVNAAVAGYTGASLAIAGSLAIASLTWRFVELPGQKVGEKLEHRIRRSRYSELPT